MSKLLLLFLILVMRTMFTFVKPSKVTYGFPFDEHIVSREFYIFSVCEKVAFIFLALIVVKESDNYKFPLWVFFSLMCADLVDFFFTFNNEWFWLGSVPMNLNNIGAILFVLVIFREIILWGKQHIL